MAKANLRHDRLSLQHPSDVPMPCPQEKQSIAAQLTDLRRPSAAVVRAMSEERVCAISSNPLGGVAAWGGRRRTLETNCVRREFFVRHVQEASDGAPDFISLLATCFYTSLLTCWKLWA